MVERCPDKTEAVSSILTTRTGLIRPFTFMDENNPKIEKPWWRDGLIVFFKVSAYIAFPIIIASFAGKSLDKKYNSDPFIFLTLIAVAFITTTFLIVKEAKAFKDKMDKEQKEKNN